MNSFIDFIFSTKMSNVTVIDMTGPEKRVLSGYHALGQARVTEESLYEQRPSKTCTNFTLPELMHNLDLILDMCEQVRLLIAASDGDAKSFPNFQQIISLDKSQKSSIDRQAALRQDKENLEKVARLENDHIETLENALELVKCLTEPEKPLTLEYAAKIFIRIQSEYPAEYKEFGLSDLVPGVIAPLFQVELQNWNPLEKPTHHVDLLKQWGIILGVQQTQSSNVFDPYSALVWSGVMPSIRSATSNWNPRDHQPMAALLDAWAPLFPSHILDNVLEQLILPRINSCVEQWDPLTDTIPIHVWILPWANLLRDKLDENIYPTIREKLGNALIAWLPSDRSARAMILPWNTVFADGDMQAFLLKYIIPKLQMSLAELIINPLQQDLEYWNQVWEWNELIPPLLMSQILDKFFFPKWMQTLVIWLNQSPNLDQVSRWYTGWKNLLSDAVLKQTVIKGNVTTHFSSFTCVNCHLITGFFCINFRAFPSSS